MPNVVNRYKPNPLMKMEKENENKDLRRKLKSLHKERSPGLNSNKETVWDRLSRVKKSASNEGNFLTGSKSRTLIPAKSSLRLSLARSSLQRTVKRPLTPNTNLNKRVTEKKSVRKMKCKPTHVQELEEDARTIGCKRMTSVKEIMTARSICNSKTSSDESASKKASARSDNMNPKLLVPRIEDYDSEDFELDNHIESPDSLVDFMIAPLMPVPTTESLNMSANIASNFRCLLDYRKKNMAPDEISVIKNVVKTDERHRQLQPNDSVLFKEILKTQLKEIVRQETVIKSALHNLNEQPEADYHPSTLTIHELITPDSGCKKQQVDVIFKNVPTLEKEIIIFKALGEKLEATLKRTVSHANLQLLELTKFVTPLANKWYYAYPDNMQYASIESAPKGVRRCMDIVQEFRMEHKTIVELKEQINHHFYLPSSKDKTELKRTSFKRLKENPDLLMRYLKPKNTLVPFNVLEQDPCFFNSFLYSPCVIGNMESSASVSKDSCREEAGATKIPVKYASDSARSARVPYKYVKEPLKIEEIQSTLNDALFNEQAVVQSPDKNLPKPNDAKDSEQPRLCEAPVRGRRRRRIRKHNTPLSPDNNYDPKTNLFKTVLVGSVQISVFLLLIMAITYPDIRC